MKAADPSAPPRPSQGPPSTRVPVSRRAPVSTRMPASSRVPSNKATGPASVRAPAVKVAPKSKRAVAREEVSIPPIWSDVDDLGKTMPATEVMPILPAPLPTKVATPVHDEAAAAVPVPLGGVLSPYAKGALGLLAVAGLVLFARGAFRHAPHAAPATVSAATTTESAPAIPPPPAETAEAPVEAPIDTATTASAAEDKKAALEALNKGKLPDAVAAGERSTTADPTDAEAWLVLGAAYQDQGNFIAAQRCFHTCVAEAKRGDVRECKFLMR